MNKTVVLGLAFVVTLFTAACSGDTEEEQTGASSDELSAGCISSIKARPGSPEWSAELQKCFSSGSGSSSGGNVPPTTGGGKIPTGGGNGQSCSTSVQCINGSCTCGDGANKGASCDGTTSTGDKSCSVLCKSCK